jgi:hypothetical protein
MYVIGLIQVVFLRSSIFFASRRPCAAAHQRGSPTELLPLRPPPPAAPSATPPPPSAAPSPVVRSSNVNARAPPCRLHLLGVDAGAPPRRPHLFRINTSRPQRHPGIPSTIRRRPDSAVGNNLNSND